LHVVAVVAVDVIAHFVEVIIDPSRPSPTSTGSETICMSSAVAVDVIAHFAGVVLFDFSRERKSE
jgi:hypothetical protein